MTFGRPLPEVANAGPADLEPSRRSARPVVLRGLVRDWPLVRSTDPSAELRAMDSGRPAPVMTAPAAIGGRPFYNADLTGFNFRREAASVGQVLDRLAREPDDEPAMIYMGSAPADQVAPGFSASHPAPGLPHDAAPRLWIGGAVTIQTHYDMSDNLACVAVGRRTFTLFPPEQVANIYVGPLDFNPAGQPVSLVQFDQGVDETRFPRFAKARAAALSATLQPGDAIYIPPMWWHHVRSEGRLNVLVNYWWDEVRPGALSPFDSLVHALAAVGSLPPERREAWRAAFDHYVFDADPDRHAHIPAHARSVLGALDVPGFDRIRRFLVNGLTRR